MPTYRGRHRYAGYPPVSTQPESYRARHAAAT
jgi:hypothetical protein